MKIVCFCFGEHKNIELRSSPFFKEDNIVGILPNRSEVEIEHVIYNDVWFRLKNQNVYTLMWLRTSNGLIDCQIDRACLKMFPKKNIDSDITEKLEKLIISEPRPPSPQPTRYKKERIPATVRNILWVTHFKTSKKGLCWLCGVEDISSANFECGHVISEKNGGRVTLDNLRPICSFCNKSVGTMNMEDFKKKYNIN